MKPHKYKYRIRRLIGGFFIAEAKTWLGWRSVDEDGRTSVKPFHGLCLSVKKAQYHLARRGISAEEVYPNCSESINERADWP